MCEIAKAGSFDDRKYRDTFTRLPLVTLSKEYIRCTPLVQFFLKKRKISNELSEPRAVNGSRQSVSMSDRSAISDNAALELQLKKFALLVLVS